MTDRRPQTIQFFLPQGKPRGIRRAVLLVRVVRPLREGRRGCRGAQTGFVNSEPLP